MRGLQIIGAALLAFSFAGCGDPPSGKSLSDPKVDDASTTMTRHGNWGVDAQAPKIRPTPQPLSADVVAATSFDDVMGADQAKHSLQELIDGLKGTSRAHMMGLKPPHGVLLVGPPGTGKTMLARATAHAAGVPIFAVTGSDLIEWTIDSSPLDTMRQLFVEAKKLSPCIIFIDELDTIAVSPAVAKLLGSEMDGFSDAQQVYVVAATNSTNKLPPSLLRSGRFDRIVAVHLPTEQSRLQILRRVSTAPQQSEQNLEVMAKLTEGFSGAELVNLANVATRQAAAAGRDEMTAIDWEEAFDEISLGPIDDSFVRNDSQRWRIAVHEAGHALTAVLLGGPLQLQRATMVPRGGALGHTRYAPMEQTMTELDEQNFLAVLATQLGGQAAEQVLFGSFGPGAGSDLAQASALARLMVTQLGMSERLGPVDLDSINDPSNTSTISEQTHAAVDTEIRRILTEQKQRAVNLLKANAGTLQRLADLLMQQRSVSAADVHALTMPPSSAHTTEGARIDTTP